MSMKVHDAFLKYRDRFGLNQLSTDGKKGIPTQNGALFTLEYLIVLLEDETIARSVKAFEVERLRKVYDSLEVSPGLSHRIPTSPEIDSMDNNVAFLSFSGAFDEGKFAKRMKHHGETIEATGVVDHDSKLFTLASFVTAFWLMFKPWRWPSFIKTGFKPKFFWNNSKPKKYAFFGWFGRSPGFMGLLDIAAKGWTTPFKAFSLLVGQFAGIFQPEYDLDARKLPYVVWYFLTKKTHKTQRWFWKLMYKLWVKALLKKYPKGMKDVYTGYYGKDHPIVEHSKTHFEV